MLILGCIAGIVLGVILITYSISAHGQITELPETNLSNSTSHKNIV